MPVPFPFRRKQKRPTSTTNKVQLQTELNEAIERLVDFSKNLRQELEVAELEEARINGDGEDK